MLGDVLNDFLKKKSSICASQWIYFGFAQFAELLMKKSVETPRVHTKRGVVLFICLYIVGCQWLERGPWHDSVDCAPMSPNRVSIIDSLLP